MIAGRVEAKFTVPTGGAAVSASLSSGATGSATVPAGSYYLTAAGGISGLLAALSTALSQSVQNYPLTGASMSGNVGYGTWLSGFLCNETSGSLSPVFGATPATLAPTSSPTYNNAGALGGIDRAVGFDSISDDFRGSTTDLNVSATEDLAVAWVGYLSGSATEIVFVKGNSGASRWTIYTDTTPQLIFECVNSGGTVASVVSTTNLIGKWIAAIAVVDRSTGKMRLAAASLDGATTLLGTEVAITANAMSNADAFTVGNRAGAAPATKWLLSGFYFAKAVGACTGMSANLATAIANFRNAINSTWVVTLDQTTGRASVNWTGTSAAWSLTWTTTALRDHLGFTADIAGVTTAQTGTQQCRGVWFPDCYLDLACDPKRAPLVSDIRETLSPIGELCGLAGSYFKRHRNASWANVPSGRMWEAEATYAHASWEWFYKETQLRLGSTWFAVRSPLQIYTDAGILVGLDDNANTGTAGWSIMGHNSIEPERPVAGWDGQWTITLPTLIAKGA